MIKIRQLCESDSGAILELYREAFAGPPWNETLPDAELTCRWFTALAKTGFGCLVAEEARQIIGATWWDILTLEVLRQERGDALVEFAKTHQPEKLVWLRETMVLPGYQNQGVARQLKTVALTSICSSNKQPILILTRMREDNLPIIYLNQNLGFKKTGLHVQSSQKADTQHEYWYLLLAN